MFTINVRGALRLLKSTVQMAMGKFDMDTPNSIGGAGSTAWTWALSEVHPQTYRAAVNWARFTLAFHGTIIVLSIVFQLWWLMIVVSGAIFIGSWWKYFIAQTQHAGLRDNVPDFRLCTRSVKLHPSVPPLTVKLAKQIVHHSASFWFLIQCYLSTLVLYAGLYTLVYRFDVSQHQLHMMPTINQCLKCSIV